MENKTQLLDFKFYAEYSDDENWKTLSNTTHFHREYEIYYLLENELMYLINNNFYHVTPGTVIIIPPNTIHTTRCINQSKRKRILIQLPPEYIAAFLSDDSELLSRLHVPPFQIKKSDRKRIENLLYSILREFNAPNQNKILIKSFLVQLLVELGDLSKSDPHSNVSDSDNTTTKQMLEIVDYINQHYSEKITLAVLSEIFFLNPSYISRSFKDKLSLSFSKYLRTVRTKEVCQLLENTSLNLEEIAEKTGFGDSTDLCRTFKAIMHTSPLKYRTSRQITQLKLS